MATITAIALDAETREILARLRQDVSDRVGRAISGSGVIRALLRQAAQPDRHGLQTLVTTVERELQAGVRWGQSTGWNAPPPAKRTRTRGTK